MDPGQQGWENIQSLVFLPYIIHFNIISVNQRETIDCIEFFRCLPSVLTTWDSTHGIQGHMFSIKCWEEIHLGSQSDSSGDESAVSLLMFSPINTHILLRVEKFFGHVDSGTRGDILRASCTNWATTENDCSRGHWTSAGNALWVEEVLRKWLWFVICSLLVHQTKEFKQEYFPSGSRASS